MPGHSLTGGKEENVKASLAGLHPVVGNEVESHGFTRIRKRDGRLVPFDASKIQSAILRAGARDGRVRRGQRRQAYDARRRTRTGHSHG